MLNGSKHAGRWLAALTAPALLLAATGATAVELTDLKVYPTNANLRTSRDVQSVVVQAHYEDGTTRDVTEQATWHLADPALARLENHTLHPIKDGATELAVEFGGRRLAVPVKVEAADQDPPMSFRMDVMPIFLKAGCNSGGCHGASRGKDGFRLSLFGFDPQADYHRLTRENLGRRLNIALPDESLLLEKAAGRVTHTGGKLFEESSDMYATLRRWIREGAANDGEDVPRLTGLEVQPKQAVLEGKGSRQQMSVRAMYSDGTDRDVTKTAVLISNNSMSAPVSADGLVEAGEPGEAFMLARYGDITEGAQILVIPEIPDFTFPDTPEHNYVDTYINAKLRKVRIQPAGLCDDATFLRRVTLDIIGRVPTAEEVKAFVADPYERKREKVIDELLDRNEFVQQWVMKWAELLQIRTDNNQFSYKNAVLYFEWLRDQFAANRPMNELVQDLIAAKGGTFSNPAGSFYQVERDSLKLTENAAQVFMGMRIQCAQCHNHPFDRWTMDDYYSFAAFFAQIGRKTGEDNRETIIFNQGGGGVRHPVGNRDMPPKFLGGATPDVNGKDRREVLAVWLASPENPYFAKNLANMVWAHFLGKGIVDPVDDVRISNPPSNPELLEELGRRFQESNYDFRKLVRDICNSQTYQRTVETNDSNREDERNFSHAYVRRIRAEVLLDVISQVTDTQNKFRGLPPGASATEIVDGRTSTYFLTTFGRATRESVCSCEVQLEPNLSQALHLLNGDTVNQKIRRGGLVRDLLKEGRTRDQIIEEIYLRTLSRPPLPEESAQLATFFADGQKEEDVLEDIFWSVLNSKEFVFNH